MAGKANEEQPAVVQSLLDKEISNNWVVATSLTLEEAKKLAVGKLNVVCLVLDSTVCQVNTRCLHRRQPGFQGRAQASASAPRKFNDLWEPTIRGEDTQGENAYMA